MNAPLRVVDAGRSFPRVDLMEPSGSGYILLAAEVDRRPAFLWPSATKRRLLRDCKATCARLRQADRRVIDATVFRALLVPPGRGPFLERLAGRAHLARFDVVVLIEAADLEAARRLRSGDAFVALESLVRRVARHTYRVAATNPKRIAPVDHSRDGVFLFNYFVADDTETNLATWEYTAGWFQQETGLDNSTVLLPVEGDTTEYNIINHCRWDHLADILPSLVFKRSFRSYVLANFQANRVAPLPILYRLA